MSVQQKETLKFVMDWGAKLIFGVLAYLAVTSFQELKTDIKQVSTDVQGIRERLIRIETKQEDGK
jgi:hypothetical protein